MDTAGEEADEAIVKKKAALTRGLWELSRHFRCQRKLLRRLRSLGSRLRGGSWRSGPGHARGQRPCTRWLRRRSGRGGCRAPHFSLFLLPPPPRVSPPLSPPPPPPPPPPPL